MKPFYEVITTLMADQNSDFCVTSPSNWKMFQSPTGQRIVVPQHSQWIVLNKIHAQTMTSRWQGMHAANGWTVPVWTGGGINHIFPNLPKSVLLSKDFGTCTDEWVFFFGCLWCPSDRRLFAIFNSTTKLWPNFVSCRRCSTRSVQDVCVLGDWSWSR